VAAVAAAAAETAAAAAAGIRVKAKNGLKFKRDERPTVLELGRMGRAGRHTCILTVGRLYLASGSVILQQMNAHFCSFAIAGAAANNHHDRRRLPPLLQGRRTEAGRRRRAHQCSDWPPPAHCIGLITCLAARPALLPVRAAPAARGGQPLFVLPHKLAQTLSRSPN